MYEHYERQRSDNITDPAVRQQRPISTISGWEQQAVNGFRSSRSTPPLETNSLEASGSGDNTKDSTSEDGNDEAKSQDECHCDLGSNAEDLAMYQQSIKMPEDKESSLATVETSNSVFAKPATPTDESKEKVVDSGEEQEEKDEEPEVKVEDSEEKVGEVEEKAEEKEETTEEEKVKPEEEPEEKSEVLDVKTDVPEEPKIEAVEEVAVASEESAKNEEIVAAAEVPGALVESVAEPKSEETKEPEVKEEQAESTSVEIVAEKAPESEIEPVIEASIETPKEEQIKEDRKPSPAPSEELNVEPEEPATTKDEDSATENSTKSEEEKLEDFEDALSEKEEKPVVQVIPETETCSTELPAVEVEEASSASPESVVPSGEQPSASEEEEPSAPAPPLELNQVPNPEDDSSCDTSCNNQDAVVPCLPPPNSDLVLPPKAEVVLEKEDKPLQELAAELESPVTDNEHVAVLSVDEPSVDASAKRSPQKRPHSASTATQVDPVHFGECLVL
jgi:neurobeachin